MRSRLVAALPVVVAAALAGGASAQTADQIISALKPGAASLHGATRGIRPVGPAPAEDAAPAAPTHARQASRTVPQAASANPSLDLSVQFRSGSAELTPAAERTLDALGRALSSATLASYRFRIEGHTDTVGSPPANKALSDARAKTVADYLATKYGVASTRVEAVGLGSDDLAIQTGDQVAEARNRRVHVVNLGAS